MKFFKLALAAAAATAALSGAAMAEEVSLSYNVGIASDYVFRGVSQTQEDPQVFGGVDLGYGIGYAGVWASNVDFGTSDPSIEVDLYGGIKPTVGDATLDFGVLYYGYSEDKGLTPGKFSYTELKAAVSKPVGKVTLGAAVYWSPEWPGDLGSATYAEVNGSVPLSEKFSLSAALGKQSIEDAADYTTWNVGVGYALTEKLALDVRYWDTSEHDFGDIYKSRVAVSLKAAF
ncbi:TorF family putative porin [Caulobacter hibisci]|uniref:Outer membrane protein beta-barrel domain-containing protein n=1 Tax=Caulobacter hibisci TaxID=2035993 RepID=A0ABS0T3M2_9CAUL|nr:TorF family putative porin [Caulobacter hibisci]MBI1686486.1 hypothetical protein [Caulobacter hibisci]